MSFIAYRIIFDRQAHFHLLVHTEIVTMFTRGVPAQRWRSDVGCFQFCQFVGVSVCVWFVCLPSR